MLTFTEAQLMAWVTPVLWPFLRVLGVFTTAPVFSSRAFPVRARIGLAFMVALCAQATLDTPPMIGLNDAVGTATGTRARAPLSSDWQRQISDHTAAGNQRLMTEWSLPLDTYGYPLPA